LRKRRWFDRGSGLSPRYYRNEPIITDREVEMRLRWGRPIPRWLRREWKYVIQYGYIQSDVIGIRDTVWPEPSMEEFHRRLRGSSETGA
jgi:hypothetical protein